MTRMQRGVAYIAASVALRRDTFLKSYPADLLDAAVSKGYVEERGDFYQVTESGHRAINDKGDI